MSVWNRSPPPALLEPTGRPRRSGLFQRRRLFLSGLAVVAYAPVDYLVAQRFLPGLLLLRIFWAALFVASGELILQTSSKSVRSRIGLVTATTAPIFQAIIAYECGPVGNPNYFWMVGVPLASVLVAQDDVIPVVSAGVAAVASTVVAVVARGASFRTALSLALIVAGAALHGIAASVLIRSWKRAQRRASERRRRAEAQLQESERQRARAERLANMGQLAAGVAHEINNPLAFVRSNLKWIEEQRSGGGLAANADELAAILKDTRLGVERISSIVRDLKSLGQSDVEETPELFSVAEAVAEASRMTGVRTSRVARLRVELEPGLPTVLGSRLRLIQALVNLIVNSADAIEQRGEARPEEQWIRLQARREADQLTIEVEDSGPGLSSEARQHAFELFFTTKGARGTGLGLALSRENAQRFGGDLEILEPRGAGARFLIRLPAAPRPEQAARIAS